MTTDDITWELETEPAADITWELEAGGITDHSELTGRDTPDQHPIEAIGGLEAALTAASDDLAAHAQATTTAHGGIIADDDPRLTDARTPAAHAASHATAGVDPITPADLGAQPSSPLLDAVATGSTAATPTHTPVLSSTVRLTQKGRMTTGTPSGLGAVGNRIWAASWIPAGTYSRLGIAVSSPAAMVLRVGLHWLAAGGVPGEVLHDLGLIDTSTGTGLLDVVTPFTIPVDAWYWPTAQVESRSATPSCVIADVLNAGADAPFPGWPSDASSSLRSFAGMSSMTGATPGALTNAPPLTGSPSTGLSYLAAPPRFFIY